MAVKIREKQSRAGFHVLHVKNISERGAILHEMMREKINGASAYWAAQNNSIVLEDEQFNEAYVNDGTGAFIECADPNDVIDYSDSRIRRLSSKLREDKIDKNGRKRGGSIPISLFVSHLPLSLCNVVPDFYPVRNKEGKEIGRRPRYVAKDRDETRRYFNDVLDYLADNVIPGGKDAILGYDIQHSETTPHIQIMADTFDNDPKKPGKLRQSWSRAYGGSRDVRKTVIDKDGKEKSKIIHGKEKFENYHAGLKAYLIEKGWDIEADFDPERHLVGMGKEEFVKAQENLYTAQYYKEYVSDLGSKILEAGKDLTAREREVEAGLHLIAEERDALATERETIKQENEAIKQERASAYSEGHKEGYQKGYEEGKVEGYSQGKKEGYEAGRAALTLARQRYKEAEQAFYSLMNKQKDNITALVSQEMPNLLSKFVRKIMPKHADKFLEDFALFAEKSVDAQANKNGMNEALQRKAEEIRRQVMEMDKAYENDSYEASW